MRRLGTHRAILLLAAAVAACSLSAAALAQTPAPLPGGTRPRTPPVSPPTPGPQTEVKHPPVLALQPGQMTKLPQGQRANDLALPLTHGQFRILRTGSLVNPLPTTLDPANGRPDVQFFEVSSPGQVPGPAQHLALAPPYVPAGWQLEKVTGATAGQQALGVGFTYTRDGYFYISVGHREVGKGVIDLVNPNLSSKHALTLSSIHDIPVVVEHQAPGARVQAVMEVMWVQNGIYSGIEAPAGDLDELLHMATALIDAAK